LSALALAEGEPKWAAQLLGASLAVRESIARPLSRDDRAAYDARRDVLREALGESSLCALWAEGRAFTLEQAVTYALTGA
jgi:hypothetical protein